MAVTDKYNVIPTITAVAQANGVDPALAIAMATQESGLNPYAVGDHGSSFGLFQLHIGGMLPAAWQAGPWVNGPSGRIPQAAADARANAQISLSHVGVVAREHPTWSAGQIAAAAQRPADPTGYARNVNSLIGGNNNYAALLPASPGSSLAATPAGLTDSIPGLGQATDALSFLRSVFSAQMAIRAIEIAAGTMLVFYGWTLISVVLFMGAATGPLKKAVRLKDKIL